MVDELKPKIDATYRTLDGPDNTFTMGSSMGGLISFYLVQNHPDTFGACGCLSTHVTWSEQMLEWFMGRDPGAAEPTPYLVQELGNGATLSPEARVYFDYGTQGLDAAYGGPHDALREWLLAQGFVDGENFMIRRFDGADHSETAWRARVDQQLDWLLRPR